jgi:cell division protein FtsB
VKKKVYKSDNKLLKRILVVFLMLFITSCYSIKSTVINKLDKTFPKSKYTIERLEKIKDSLNKRWQKIETSF